MADDTTLNIKTVVDTSQLEAGMQRSAESVNQFAQQATVSFASVKEAESALADAQKQLGLAASQGSEQAAAVIADYELAVENAKAAVAEETAAIEQNTSAHIANNRAVYSGISDRMAASAALRTFEGGLTGSTRAAGALLTNVLGLGPIIQAAFPVIGAIALGEVLFTVGERVYELYQNVVNLKTEIEGLAEASNKTAQKAAEANYKWVESQIEVLKAQGKMKEAQEFLQAHAGDKPVTLSLDIDDSKLKKMPQDIQDLAEKLKEVHTQAQAQSVFKEIDTQIAATQTKINGFEDDIVSAQKTIAETLAHPAIGEDVTATVSGGEFAIEGYQHQLTAATEYYNVLKNLRNTNISDLAADANKQTVSIDHMWDHVTKAAKKSAEEERAAELAAVEAQVEATKQGSQERIDAIRAELAMVDIFYGEQSAEYQKMLGRLNAADRERTAELQRQTTQQLEEWLRATQQAAAAQQQETEKAIADRQKELEETKRITEQELSSDARKDSRFGLIDLGKMESDIAQAKAIEAKYTADVIALAQQTADAKIAALEKVIETAEAAALADPADSRKFLADAQAAAQKQVEIETELQAKLKQLRQQGAEDAKKIEDQFTQYKEQEEQRITNRMLQFEDQALFHSKSFGQAVQDIYRDLAQSVISDLMKMVDRWIVEHVVMLIATKLFHTQVTTSNAQAAAQQQMTTIATNIADVVSQAGVAAARAYAAYAENPPVASAMAAAAEASVLAFIPEAAAEGGFDVPYGVSPITQLHSQEMVLPREHADTIRSLGIMAPQLPDYASAFTRGEFAGSVNNVSNNSRNESGGDFHYHAGDVNASALDRNGMSEIFRSHQREIAKAATKMFKAGQFSRR